MYKRQLLDDAPDADFDEEIAKLEEMLANEQGPSEDERGNEQDDD